MRPRHTNWSNGTTRHRSGHGHRVHHVVLLLLRRTVPKPTDRITELLSERIGAHRYEMWFGQADISVDGSDAQVTAHSQFVADWISHRFDRALRTVASETLGSDAGGKVSVESFRKVLNGPTPTQPFVR